MYEHITGGGLINEPLTSNLLSEAYAMVHALVEDFLKAKHSVTLLLDSRLKTLFSATPSLFIHLVKEHDDPTQILTQYANHVDANMIIAPEHNRILSTLVLGLEQNTAKTLNGTSKSIIQASNKHTLSTILSHLKIPTPPTIAFTLTAPLDEIHAQLSTLTYPLILKPIDGISCSGLSLVSTPEQIHPAIQRIHQHTKTNIGLAQPFIKGIPVSVSLLASEKDVIALSLNRQFLELNDPKQPSRYIGGHVPYNHPLKKQTFAICKQLIRHFKGLRGYLGIDLILTKDTPMVLEINPRLTTSYLGIRQVLDYNIGQLLIDAALHHQFPPQKSPYRYAIYKKTRWPIEIPTRIPPSDYHVYHFPLTIHSNTVNESILTVTGKTLESAAHNLQIIEKNKPPRWET